MPNAQSSARLRRGRTPKPVPWSALRRAGRNVVEAYVDASRTWVRLVEVIPSEHVHARATADFIIQALMAYDKNRALIASMIGALEICLDCKTLSWEAEHDAEIVLRRAKAGG